MTRIHEDVSHPAQPIADIRGPEQRNDDVRTGADAPFAERLTEVLVVLLQPVAVAASNIPPMPMVVLMHETAGVLRERP